MSNAVFPSLIGLEWPVQKTPTFNTIEHKTVSGMRKALSMQPYPIWTFELSFSYLADTGLATDDYHLLQGFFLDRYGKWDDFLFYDKYDNAVTAEVFGVGDGVAKQFQLVRAFRDFIEPILGVLGAPSIYINGVLQSSGYTISTTGLVTFTAAPAAAAVITWTGQFYYRCHFTEDANQCSYVMDKWVEAKKVTFESVLNSDG